LQIKGLQMLVPKEELRPQARELVVQPIKELQMLVPKEELRLQARELVVLKEELQRQARDLVVLKEELQRQARDLVVLQIKEVQVERQTQIILWGVKVEEVLQPVKEELRLQRTQLA
jgi:hypothetical protein